MKILSVTGLICIAAVMSGVLMVSGCDRPDDHAANWQQQIDSLQKKLNDTYKPGLGEFMSGIQVHHAKLWFAGRSANWQLAGFEIDEIRESVDDIKKFCTDRPEVASLEMIGPALDSVASAIAHENSIGFTNGFVLLTQTCNTCHKATQHAFNVIRIPDTPPFSNQVFAKPHEKNP